MGLFLLLILSVFFGWVFTEAANRRTERVQSQLEEKLLELERVKEQHEFEKRVWKKTVEELLRD